MATTRFIDHLLEGDHASRPAAGDVPEGTLYSCTTHSLVYQSDGTSTWSTWFTGSTGFTDPMTTRGDIIIRNASNVTDRLGVGGAGEVLTSDGTDVSWEAPTSGGVDNWLIEGTFFIGAHGNTNWTTFNPDNAEVYCGDQETSGAQNDEIYWDLGISGGTWDLSLLHYKGTNRGIYTVSIDGSSIGTIDGYNGTNVRNQIGTLTGVSITAGKRRLKFKMATKNASSSGYYGTAQAWQLRRTA